MYTHLPAEVEVMVFESVSSFPYESYLYKLKRMIRRNEHVIQQLVSRINEKKVVDGEKD